MAKLTKRTVDAVRPDPKRELFLWDDELRGFGLRVLPSGRRSYFIQYRVGRRTRRLALGPHGVLTPEQARLLAAERLHEVRHGGDPSAKRRQERAAPTIAELGSRFMRDHSIPKKRPSSVETDRRILEKVILPYLGRFRVAELTRADVSRWHASLQKTPAQANRSLAVLSKMMNLAERWDLRRDGSNPCRHVDRYREMKRERFLSSAEIARLGETLASMLREGQIPGSVAAGVRLLMFTGARRGEILGLRWEYVDFERRCLRLPDSKTGAKTIALNAPALQILAELPRRSEWVLPTEVGDTPVSLSRPWERIRQRAGLPRVRIHDLRHTHASILAAAGVPLLVIGRVLGHTVPATTARYAHLADDPVREASEVAGARLVAAMSGAPRPAADVVPLHRQSATVH